MEQKPASSNKNLTPYIAIGGIGLAIFGASYYIWKRIANKRKPGSKGKRLPKDLVIKILITTKRELFPLWNTLAGECKGFLDANNLRIVPHKMKMIFLQKGQQYISTITKKVLAEYKVDPDNYNYSLYEFITKREVNQRLNAITEELNGVVEARLSLQATIPEFLTPKRSLEIFVKAIQAHMRQLNKIGQVAIQNADQQAFYSLIGDPELVAVKVEVMKKEGLDGFEDHPDKILAYAMSSFASKDEGYRMKLEKLTNQTMGLLDKIFLRDPDLEKAIEEFGKDEIETPEVVLPCASKDKI